jgi:phosphoribosylaminoimidazole-succinocarboxamide synthase
MNKQYVTPANLRLWHSGKVRDTASIPGHHRLLLPVASHRISTHNVTHLSLIPGKGEILTAQMLFFHLMVFDASIETHIVAYGKRIYDYLPKGEYDPRLHYRAIIVRQRNVTQKEFIYRSYLAGSLYREYIAGKDSYGLHLLQGLPLMHRFEDTIFTPTEKSENDEPLPYRSVQVSAAAGCLVTHNAYDQGRIFLMSRDITLIDAKFEAAKHVLVDEWLTGDCSRMAWTKDVHEGEEPPWLDKEVFRQEAARMWGKGPKKPLTFSAAAIKKGLARYHEAFEGITGQTLEEFQKKYLD